MNNSTKASDGGVMLVGCGGIARAHVAAIGGAAIVALCDANLEIARRLGDETVVSAPIYNSLEIALTARQPEIVVICTPPTTHFALANAALEAGAHVLCEKPLTTRVEQAQALVELARSRGVTLRTSAKYRFDAGVGAAKSWLDSGAAGALRNLKIAFGTPFNHERSWHGTRALSGGGVWMDNGPHALDLARFFAGELKLSAIENWKLKGDVETEARIKLRADTGVGVQIELSWERSLGEIFAVLSCDNGTIEVGWQRTSWRPRAGDMQILAGVYDKRACFAAQWNAFETDDARWTSCDGARVVELLEATNAHAAKCNLV